LTGLFVINVDKLTVVSKIIAGQALIVVLVSLLFYLFGNVVSGKSALYGGIAVLIPNLYFALKIQNNRGQDAKKIVRSFYAGESGKLILTAIIFAVIFQDSEINIIALLVTYVAALTVFWFALLIRKY